MSTQTTNESTEARPIAPEIPKSPPKWPLRPGVLVHVKCDTKQNLCANRAQSPLNTSMNTSNLNNVSYASPLLSGNTSMASAKGTAASMNLSSTPITVPDLPTRNIKMTNTNGTEATTNNNNNSNSSNNKKSKPVARALLIDEDGITAKVESDESSKEDGCTQMNTTNSVSASDTVAGLLQNSNAPNNEPNNNDELLRFTSSNLIERILGRLRWRREQSTAQNNNVHGCRAEEEGILAKSNKRAVSLLRATGWFGSGKSTNSTTGLMSETAKNHLNGIAGNESGKYHVYLSIKSHFSRN